MGIVTRVKRAGNGMNGHEPTPYELGQRDAESGLLCVPEMYFVRRDQALEYVRGHASVATSLLAEQIMGRNVMRQAVAA